MKRKTTHGADSAKVGYTFLQDKCFIITAALMCA